MDEEVKSTSWGRPPVREIALGLAIEHWNGSVRPAVLVVKTAETFLTFLLADEARVRAPSAVDFIDKARGEADQAAVAEAQQQALINETREKANTQFAGSGLVVNITGLPTNDAAAIADEMSKAGRWYYRRDDDDGEDFVGAAV